MRLGLISGIALLAALVKTRQEGDYGEPMAKAQGGPYIGPRGGKWANPEHTIPWDDEVHGKRQAKPQPQKPPAGTYKELTHNDRSHLISHLAAHADGKHPDALKNMPDHELKAEAAKLGIDHGNVRPWTGHEKLRGAVGAHPKARPGKHLDDMSHHELIAHAKELGVNAADPQPFHGAKDPRWAKAKGKTVDRSELEHVVSELGGGEWNEQFKVTIPHNPERVWNAFLAERDAVAKRIGETPKGISEAEAIEKWTNDHSMTEAELADLAKRTKPSWTSSVRKISDAIGGKVEAAFGGSSKEGEVDQHATKGMGSLTRKSKKIQDEQGVDQATAVNRKVGDSIRGSIVVDTPEQLGAAVREAVRQFGSENIVVDNKFVGKPNKSGYTGVHCDVWFPDANGTRIKAELQFHVRSFYDGSEDNVKGQAHTLYEATRETHAGDPGLLSASHLLFLAGLKRIPPRG